MSQLDPVSYTHLAEQICRAEKMVANGSLKKQRKNPNDPARFVNKVAVTNEGEKAKIHYYLDTDKIAEEEMYDGLYAVCTDPVSYTHLDVYKRQVMDLPRRRET